MRFLLNVDLGEGYSGYKLGDDAALMPSVDLANIACGFHASDPPIMERTVQLAKRYGKLVGAHPSLPDRDGFGRREMKIPRGELVSILIYQIGALKGFLQRANMPLNHIKPHGALSLMAMRDEEYANALCDVAEIFEVPLIGALGTCHETVCEERGIQLIGEFYADLEYDVSGRVIVTREHPPYDPERAASRVRQAVMEGTVESDDRSKILPIRFDSICLHSDTPNAVDVVACVATALKGLRNAQDLHSEMR